jgi:ABC-type dipeptide/oligopeptide/nickel transport system ATPase subunit
MTDPVISVRDLRMRYGTHDVLEGVEFEVGRGEVICLLGPNGAGKTTTIEILEGFRMRSAGEVRVLGEDPARAGEDWRARTGVVLQSWRDHPRWTPRRLLGEPHPQRRPARPPTRRDGAHPEPPQPPSSCGAGSRRSRAGDRARARCLGGVRGDVTPLVLRRMARRQSGSQMEAARETAAQFVR